ncbi:MAG: FHA domain-containing serine/threonine-protein kinase [Actinomycetota bacterium]
MKEFAGYEIVEQLRPGNHGTFHLAHPPARLGLEAETVALKVLDRHASDNEFKRMAAELEVLLELGHPRLVPVLDAGHEEGRLFYATTYYADGSLGAGPTADPARVSALVADAAEAAHALHERGVAHRDIKPSNILLADGRGHLGDLGVANYLDARFTATGSSPVGTLTFSDPRLIHGDAPGRSSDIWSLGATLHMALTGVSVIGDIPNAHLAAAIEYVIEARPRIAATCPDELQAIIGRCSQPDRLDRYPTAIELAADLRAFAGVSPSVAHADDAERLAATDDEERRGFPVEKGRVAALDLPPHQHPVLVVGSRSSAGWFNRPDARACRVTGETRDGERPWIAERRTRPPLGTLVDNEGNCIVVQWDLVIGRQPDADPAVADGVAQAIAYPDDQTMSRAHLRITLDGWAVTATDQSSNGTRHRSGADGAVALLPKGTPVALGPGDVLFVEGRSYTFHPTR